MQPASTTGEEGLDLQSIRDELVCPMCISTFVEPRSLHCLHSYCEACLDGLHKANISSDVLFCPECRTRTTLPPAGVKGLPVNFKLRRFVELLTVEQRREMVIHSTQKVLPLSNPRPTCPVHNTKPLEYYCESCRVLVCGQCMLDDHRIHGNVKFASEVLDDHVQELQKIVPDADNVAVSGEAMLVSLKSEVTSLNDELTDGTSTITSYFEKLHDVLKERENDILNDMKAKAKKKEKELQKHIKTLHQAVEGVKKSKMTLEEALEARSDEVGLLLEENQLKARILASMKLVKEEAFDCKLIVGGFSNFPPFKIDPSVEGKCRSITYVVDSPDQRRSQTAMPADDMTGSRGRTRPYIHSDSKHSGRLFSDPEIQPYHKPAVRSPVKSATIDLSIKPLNIVTVPDPIAEIGRKALIGHYNHVTAFPFGICCTSQPEGALLVTDAKHHLFRIITSTGKCLETVGAEGKGDGQFTGPVAISVDALGNLLVLDGKSPGRLQKFSNAGKFLSKFKVRGLRTGGSPYLLEPNGLAITTSRKVLVTDGAKACIHEFDESGKYVGKFGTVTEFKYPVGIAVSTHRVVVCDRDADCIYILTEHGQQLARVGQRGTSPGDLSLPYGVTLDKNGNIVVSECGNHRISIFTAGGKFVRCFGCKGSDPGMFRFPRHLCFNHLGQLVVADEENQRLQLFDLYNLDK